MAYGKIYEFIFESSNGAEVKIEVLKNGYSGSSIQRPLGGAPVLRQQLSGGVAGSSLSFTPECHVDGEFSQFYTTDAKEFQVNLYRNSSLIWSGFIVPELYSEPDIAPPYDVSITAADGLGELKRYEFTPLGKVTLQALFINLMSYTGQSLPVHFISQLNYSGVSAPAFFADTYIDLDYKAGESCYDVLQYLLATFNARISYYSGAWLIARENDITFSSGKPVYINESGQSASYDGGLMEITAMGAGGLWPVEFTSSSVDPALRSLEVEAPWNLYSGLVNSGMATDTGWTKSSSSVFFINGGGYGLYPETSISQSITQLMGKPFLLTFDAATYIFYRNNVQQYSTAQVEVTFVENNHTWYLVEDDTGALVWSDTFKIVSYRIENAYGRTNAIENQLSIPVFEDENGDPVTGTLDIKIKAALNQGLYVYGVWLTVAAEKGYKDLLQLNNGARGEADGVTIAIGYETSDLDSYKAFYGGILLTGNNALVTSISTGNFSNLDFLSLISRDYARSIALPRLRTDGTLNTPSSLTLRPLLVNYRGTNRWIETFEWNLFQDDFNFSALSIPTASISVSGEVITATGSAGGSADKTIGRLTPGSGEGEDGLIIMLSNYAHVFSATSSGNAKVGSDTIRVMAFKGNTAVATSLGTITGTPVGLSVTKYNDNSTNTYLTVSVSSSLTSAGSLTIPVTADGVTVSLRYGWTLAEDGDQGEDGYNTATVTLYQRAASSPTKPNSATTYTFATGVLSGTLGDWTQTPPAADGNPLWLITAKAISRNATDTIEANEWVGPVKYVEDGLPGARGKTPRGPTEWSDAGMSYEGVEGPGDFVDFVFPEDDTSVMYYCLKDHTSSPLIPLTDTEYWASSTVTDFVATKVLYATLGYVQNLGVNIIKVMTGGTVYGGMMPPSTDGNGDTIFWAGGSTPGNSPFTIDKYGNLSATSGTFSGFLRMPFEKITDGASHLSGYSYELADKCNLYAESETLVLYLPCDNSQVGKVVNIWDFPVKTGNGDYVEIRTSIQDRMLTPTSYGTYGFTPKTYFNTGKGGLIQLVCVPGGYWQVTINSCVGVFG